MVRFFKCFDSWKRWCVLCNGYVILFGFKLLDDVIFYKFRYRQKVLSFMNEFWGKYLVIISDPKGEVIREVQVG